MLYPTIRQVIKTFNYVISFHRKWWRKRDSNPHGLSTNGFYLPLRLSPPFRFVVWTIPLPYSVADYSLCTSLFQDLAQDWHFKAFPEFTAYYYIVSNITTQLSPLWLPLHHFAFLKIICFYFYSSNYVSMHDNCSITV